MRIFDTNADTTLNDIVLYLKLEEAKELYDSIGILLKKGDFNDHAHIDDASYEHEVTVVLYDEQKTESLSERSKKIVLDDI